MSTQNFGANQRKTPKFEVDSTSEASSSLTPELVIALCGPIGSPLHGTATQIENTLREYGYRTEKIRLSDLIKINRRNTSCEINESNFFNKIKSQIEMGDELRERYGSDILAKLAIAKIGADRKHVFGQPQDAAMESTRSSSEQIQGQRICHVVDSIKNQSELELLRLVYGNSLFSIGVFSPLHIRHRNLEKPGGLNRSETNELIDQDSGEEFDHGQSVGDTFPHCDFFIRVDKSIAPPDEGSAVAEITEKIRRLFDLVFRTSVITPTPEETAMFAASSAAKNSACLSRQVGASVTAQSGEILAVGWNDVPQSGGGLYGKRPLHTPHLLSNVQKVTPIDERCFAKTGGHCSNNTEKEVIADKIIERLVDKGLISEEKKHEAVEAVSSDTRVKDLIEFSRAVHAEMHAILGASRVAGDRVLGGKIYVTTYPCHSCARHLVAAGISEIVYIEPYRKSLATRLHEDALTESADDAEKVRILQFDGVSPRRFLELFEGGSRKADGVLKLSSKESAIPSTRVSMKAIPRLEEVVVAEVQQKDLILSSLVSEDSRGDENGEASGAA